MGIIYRCMVIFKVLSLLLAVFGICRHKGRKIFNPTQEWNVFLANFVRRKQGEFHF